MGGSSQRSFEINQCNSCRTNIWIKREQQVSKSSEFHGSRMQTVIDLFICFRILSFQTYVFFYVRH